MSSAFSPPPIPSPSAKMKSEFGWLTAVTMVGLGAMALLLCALQYHRERIATLQVLDSAAAERVMALDVVLAASVRPVTALRRAAETLPVEAATPFPPGLKDRPDGGFALDAGPESAAVTGPGSLRGRSAEVTEAVQRTLTLARLEPTLFTLAPNLTTLTFRTPQGVTARFPAPSAPSRHDGSDDDRATPQPGPPPGHRPMWSQVTADKPSLTLLVRYTEPAWRGDRFLGSAAADISLEFLRQVIEMPDYSGQRLVLVDRSRHVLADSRIGASQGKDAMLALGEILPASLVPDTVFAADATGTRAQIPTHGYTVLIAPLTAAPWVLVCLVPEGALFLRVMPWFTIALILIVALFAALTTGHLFVSRRFIKPALTLVRLIGAEASGDVLPPQRVPLMWQPLFGRVAGAFAASRAQLARAVSDAALATRTIDEHALERTRVEATLRQEIDERGFADALFDHAPALVLVLDRDGRIVRFNRRCEAVSGILAAAARGRHPWEFLVPPGDVELIRVQVETVLRGDGPISGACRWLSPGSAPRRITWSLAALFDTTGDITHVIAIGLESP